MTMEAFAIVVRVVEVEGRSGVTDVLHVDVPQTADLCANAAIHRVVGVAGIARLVTRDSGVLKVGGGKKGRVINQQASTVRFHDVAREAKISLPGALHMLGRSERGDQGGQQKEHHKGKHLPTARSRDRRPHDHNRDEHDRNSDHKVKQSDRAR